LIKNYIDDNKINPSLPILLCPSFAKPNFDYRHFEGKIINKTNIKEFLVKFLFFYLLNTGNYVLNKKIIDNLKYDASILEMISACDVLYFNLQCFQQFDSLQLHIVPNLEYTHIVHAGSIYLETEKKCAYFRDAYVTPEYYKL